MLCEPLSRPQARRWQRACHCSYPPGANREGSLHVGSGHAPFAHPPASVNISVESLQDRTETDPKTIQISANCAVSLCKTIVLLVGGHMLVFHFPKLPFPMPFKITVSSQKSKMPSKNSRHFLGRTAIREKQLGGMSGRQLAKQRVGSTTLPKKYVNSVHHKNWNITDGKTMTRYMSAVQATPPPRMRFKMAWPLARVGARAVLSMLCELIRIRRTQGWLI